ncbi:MAG: reprolysin-like metallopeptidase, partial [Flavisolibacter sp.]
MKSPSQIIIALVLLCSTITGFAQVPVYNSYPSASATMFLDFDGHLVAGTSWNMNGDIPCNPSNLTSAQITEIFNRVAEDYRPFNINITTDSTKYWSAPVYKRMRVVLTTSSSWYGSAGGVSYIGSFIWGDNTPAFVFSALLNYNTKNVAEATSHELGHTLGLNHQSSYDGNCNKSSEYNTGTGGGEIGWAPIMGSGYYRNMTLWNNGANPYGCTSFQDDLAIITSMGFGYRTDDHPDNSSTATNTVFSGTQFNVNGVIERMADNDLFKFDIPAFGNFHLDATPYNIGTGNSGSNLDLQVELLSGNTILGTYNPATLVNASLDTILNAGTYYLRVAGKGNIYAPEYASLGSYSLNGTFAEANLLPLHKLELSGETENSKHKFNWIVVADETITEQVLEVSTNGRNFQSVGSLTNSSRGFIYTPSNSGILYYRLKITLDNKQEYYSNIINLKGNNQKAKPSLITNLVRNNVTVNSPSVFEYSITDYSGRIVAKGNLIQ